jgi:phage protein
MEDWTRVVLYGTYDGFVRSTYESLQIAVILDGGERVEIPSEYVMSTDQIVKKDKIKLKDVIKRIKYFDLVTQAVWINGILNELGSGFGLHKYHEGYKQGKIEGAMEREKVQVPQFVADWIEYCKAREITLAHALYRSEESKNKSVYCWIIEDLDRQETFARAWLDGYTVEEKRFLVKIKEIEENINCLNYDYSESEWYFADDENGPVVVTHHTRDELENAGFGWVFDCEGIEIEEVKE